jgi:hypothetical protein
MGHFWSSDTITVVIDGFKNVGRRKTLPVESISSKLEDVDEFRNRYHKEDINYYAGRAGLTQMKSSSTCASATPLSLAYIWVCSHTLFGELYGHAYSSLAISRRYPSTRS